MQKCNFSYNIVVGEDASTDKSREILLEYCKKYPGKFKLLLHEKNIGAMANQNEVFKACNGKYIALCEGDDYWTDPLKLQKQVDFLEENPDCVICAGGYYSLKDGQELKDRTIYHSNKGFRFTKKDWLNRWLTKTLTVVFRKTALCKYLEYVDKYNYLRDTHLYYYILNEGKGYYFSYPLGVYNIHNGGVCSLIPKSQNSIISYNIYKELLSNFSSDKSLTKKYFFSIITRIKNKGYNTKSEKKLLLKEASSLPKGFKGKIYLFILKYFW
jgi:glycosyltransferase involved in cell wall biosynthesis